jgi:glucose-1-phosphate cytidylyltransferase
VTVLSRPESNWRVTLIDTGLDTQTGGRIKRLAEHLDSPFLLTYGDGLSDVPIDQVIEHHRRSDALATVTAVHPIPRWGALEIDSHRVTGFSEKPVDPTSWVNGGYFVMEPAVLDLVDGDTTALEREPLQELAAENRLAAYQHEGFWMAMDTARDRDEHIALWDAGSAPWVVR